MPIEPTDKSATQMALNDIGLRPLATGMNPSESSSLSSATKPLLEPKEYLPSPELPVATPTPSSTATPTVIPIESVIKFDSNTIANQLTPMGVSQGYNAGSSVSVSDDVILIGTPKDPQNGSNSGSVYVFVRSGDSWSQQAKLTPSDGRQGDQFGQTVSISGNHALVGTPYSDAGATDAGATYVFNSTRK